MVGAGLLLVLLINLVTFCLRPLPMREHRYLGKMDEKVGIKRAKTAIH